MIFARAIDMYELQTKTILDTNLSKNSGFYSIIIILNYNDL